MPAVHTSERESFASPLGESVCECEHVCEHVCVVRLCARVCVSLRRGGGSVVPASVLGNIPSHKINKEAFPSWW